MSGVQSDTFQGMVVYADGGCRPNPGPGGWGFHGYLYENTAPKKGSGNPDYVVTTLGYSPKPFEPTRPDHKQVTPIHYVDGYGSAQNDISNNLAELLAAINAFQHALKYDLKVLQFFSDSEYVCKGLENWIDQWRANNWVKRDGSEISNLLHWKELCELRDQLLNRGVSVLADWVKGHTDAIKGKDLIIGNIAADKLATVGVLTSQRGDLGKCTVTVSAADGYWSYSADKHPFISSRRMYFNTRTESVIPGVYFMGEHGKDDDLLGKRVSDGAYCVVALAEPDPALEMVRQRQIQCAGSVDSIVMVRLDHLYRPSTHKELMTFGDVAMNRPNPFRLDMECLDKEPLTRELRPPKLAMRAVEALGELSEKLNLYLAKHPNIVCTDLTALLYESSVKVSKKGEVATAMKLKDDYNVGFAALSVDANYLIEENKTATASVTLTLGIDMLDRNALKRLESHNPRVTLITWTEAPHVFRYATVVETAQDRGIWAGAYSNLRVVPQ